MYLTYFAMHLARSYQSSIACVAACSFVANRFSFVQTMWDGVARPRGSGRIVQQAILLALSTSRQSQALLLWPSSPSPTKAVIFGCGFLCRPENYMTALEALVEAGAVVIVPYAPLATDLLKMDVPGMHVNANVAAKSVVSTATYFKPSQGLCLDCKIAADKLAGNKICFHAWGPEQMRGVHIPPEIAF